MCARRICCRNWAARAAKHSYVLAPVDLHAVQAAAAVATIAARAGTNAMTIAAAIAMPVATAALSDIRSHAISTRLWKRLHCTGYGAQIVAWGACTMPLGQVICAKIACNKPAGHERLQHPTMAQTFAVLQHTALCVAEHASMQCQHCCRPVLSC